MSFEKNKDIEINNIVVNANKLRHSNIQKRALKENIVEILRKINDEVSVAHREGKYNIITTMPTIFDIPNMCNKTSQRIIWYHIISHLNNQKYRVEIFPTKNFCKLKITWITKEDENTINEQISKIAECTKRF